uniref:Im:7136021 n=1 Tax=Sinocyclocheilus anshuiensis TaxID=1608454 RepID=A0A671M8X1_9TELE
LLHNSCPKYLLIQLTLPDEIWIHVFGFLSDRDKLNVRLSCTYFKRLIDHWSLWKDSIIVLQKLYDSHFWKTLCQRKIKSIVVQKATAKVLQQTVAWLPWIGSVTLVQCSDGTALVTLGALKHLQSLTSSLLSLRQLTHLCLCEVRRASISEISAAISQLVNLTTLKYHDDKNPIHKTALHGMLGRLPNLKHLSLRLGPNIWTSRYVCFEERKIRGRNEERIFTFLDSLELLNYEDPCLSSVAFNGLSSLTKLTVHYKQWHENTNFCCLTKWLQGLNVLSELNISCKYEKNLESVRIMGEQVPDLLHLHLDLRCHNICDVITEMPQIFPKLQILKVR